MPLPFPIPTEEYNRNSEYLCPRCGNNGHRVAIANRYIESQKRNVDLIRVDCDWCSNAITYVLPLNYVEPPA